MPLAHDGRLRTLMLKSDAAGPVIDFVERCDRVLIDNQMPFFPAFTDHGTSHVESVLAAAERLIPAGTWNDELVTPDDAAVLVGAVYLHDLGLHIREHGFLALVSEGSRFKPLPWFSQDQSGRPRDQQWPRLWDEYRREARSFSQSQLDRILGPGHGDPPRINLGDFPPDPREWTLNDRLVVGEFLRRHHARLAHEIAMYGFPGLPADDFPILRRAAPHHAEAIGSVARSHGENLRIAAAYLDSRFKGDLRPEGCAQLYLMGLLRVADYFQLESKRATPLLQHLREPQSPASLAEWERHQAVVAVSWDHRDPYAVSVQVSDSHTLRTHLLLVDLLASLQNELDVTAAVLGETFGATKLAALQLALRRVRTNLSEPDLHARLRFVPEPSFLRSAEDLFRLMVGDLYGNEPAVAGRELLQNAVDAVRERRRWEHEHDSSSDLGLFRAQPADVVVEIRELDERVGLLRVADRGIGMTPATVLESYLVAGASFSGSAGDEGPGELQIEHMKVGRFGIGVFAAFLLGSQLQVTTRHLEEDRGITFTARLDDELVQLDWDEEAPLGTEIVVPYLSENVPRDRYETKDDLPGRHLGLLRRIASFFALSDPSVVFLIRRRDGSMQRLRRQTAIPIPGGRLPDHWRKVETPSMDAVLWSIPARHLWLDIHSNWGGYGTKVAHNGFLIEKPDSRFDDQPYIWSDPHTQDLVREPSIAVFDTHEELKVALNRYELASSTLPFEHALLKSIGLDVVAHALACGERPYPLDRAWGLKPVVTRTKWMPFLPSLVERHVHGDLCVLIAQEPEELKIARCFLKGRLASAGWRDLPYRAVASAHEVFVDELETEWIELEDSLLRSHAEKEVRYSIDRGSEQLGRYPCAGVLASYDHPPAVLFEDSEDDDVEEKNQLLLRVAKELASIESLEFFALVILRQPEEPWGWVYDGELAYAWEQIIDGMLERGPKARQERRDQIIRHRREIGALTNKWDRFSKAIDNAKKKARESLNRPLKLDL